jgi:alkylation response protein AidB-like acyl-CoA dehydrogenase
MSHFLNEEQQMMRDVAAKFARNELLPIANEIDRTESTPEWVAKRCAELGFYGLYIAEEYGGMDAGLVTACVVLEEIAKASPAFAGLLSVQMILCPETVSILGTPEQKQRLLPPSARGERVMAYSQTEPAGVGNIPLPPDQAAARREMAIGWTGTSCSARRARPRPISSCRARSAMVSRAMAA